MPGATASDADWILGTTARRRLLHALFGPGSGRVHVPPTGFSQAELARLAGIERSSVRADIAHLLRLGLLEPTDVPGPRLRYSPVDDVPLAGAMTAVLTALADVTRTPASE